MTCSGDPDQLCGGPDRLNVFETAAVTGPQVNPGPGNWGSMGCYADPNNPGRTLRYQVATTGGQGALTIKLCVDACEAAGYTLAGAEYGGECFCDNAISNGGGPAEDGAAQCSMTCNGNKAELCGGPFRLNVYGLGYPKPTVSGASTTSTRLPTSTTQPPVSTSSSSTTPPSSSSSGSSLGSSVGSLPLPSPKAINNLKEEKLINYETYGTIELTEQGENLAKKILEAYDIIYVFLKEVLNLDDESAKTEAEKIKSVATDNTINKLAKYVHKVLGLSNLNCNYDINQEKCRNCIKRTNSKKGN